jgi:ribose transport system substrate-binding protein
MRNIVKRLPIAIVLCALDLLTAPVSAAETLKFAFVAPTAASPFFDDIAAGCAARAIALAGEGHTVTCTFVAPGLVPTVTYPGDKSGPSTTPAVPQGPEKTTTEASASSDPSPAPPETVTSSPSLSSPSTANPSAQTPAKPDPRTEAQIIADLVTAHIDGLAISPTNDPAVVDAIRAAVKAGVPVVTVDTDAPGTGRAAAIGTNARDFGRALGASLKRWKPNGGKYAILATDPQQPSMAERISGVRDALGPGWSEITDSPIVTSGDYAEAAGKIDHLLNAYYDVDAIISVGAWPMLDTDAWREMVARYKARIDKADVVLVVADALPAQKDLVRQGLGHVLVGQKPQDMGSRAVDLLLQLTQKRKVPEVVYVGFETVTRLDLVRPTN